MSNMYVVLIIVIVLLLICIINMCRSKIIESIEDEQYKNYKIKEEIYIDMLKRTKRALDKLNIPFFLSSGTCLGYFREGRFIEYDYDIDVGIWAEDYTPKIVKEMSKQGLKLYRVWGTKKSGMELSFILPKTRLGRYAKIDIFLHYRKITEGESTVSWYTYAPLKSKRIEYRVSDFDIELVDFLGIKVYVPSPTLKYIEEHYGQDWIIPKKPRSGYSYWSSPKSIVK